MKYFRPLTAIAVLGCMAIGAPTWAQQSDDRNAQEARQEADESRNQNETRNRDETSQSTREESTPANNRTDRFQQNDTDVNDSDRARQDRARQDRERRESQRSDQQNDDRFQSNRDRSERERDDLFQRDRDDRFQRDDDRSQRERDIFDRRGDQRRQDQSDDRFDSDTERNRRGTRTERSQNEGEGDVSLGASLQVNEEGRLVVSQLANRGVLSDASFRQGDVIVSVDGRRISSEAELQRWIAQSDPGERLPVIVMRNGQRQTLYLDGGSQRFGDTDIGISLRADGRGRLTVAELASRGLLADSGLRRGDVIIEAYGRPIRSQRDFVNIVRRYDDARIPVVVLRDGRRETIYVSANSRYARDSRSYHPDDYRSNHYYDGDRAWLGVYLDTRYDSHAVVEAVQVDSAADRAGIQAGDWITHVNGRQIQGPAHLSRMVRSMDPGEEVQLEVSRRTTDTLQARLGERPDSRGRFRYDEDLARRQREYDDREYDRDRTFRNGRVADEYRRESRERTRDGRLGERIRERIEERREQ